jgi:hypothetical protein
LLLALIALVLLTRCGGDGVEPEAPALEAPPLQSLVRSEQALATTYTFGPSADAWVEEASSARNHGLSGRLMVDLSPRRELYLRFILQGLRGTVTRAVLRLYATDGTVDGPSLFAVEQAWSEEELTWRNRPRPHGRPVADVGPITAGSWVEYDVTEQVRGDGTLSLALIATSNAGAMFLSREAGQVERRPQLVVTVTPEAPAPQGCMLRADSYYRVSHTFVDGFVSQDEPGKSFGADPTLSADGVPRKEAYLQFDVDTGGLSVSQAWLQLQSTGSTSNGPRLFRARSQWTEEDLTWNTRPPVAESPVGNLGVISPHTRVAYPLTGAVTEPGRYSFGLLAESGDSVAFASREGASVGHSPQLHYLLKSPLFCSYHGAGGGLTDWVRQHGGSGPEQLDALAPHPEGGFVVAGRFDGAALLPEEGLALARYSASGGLVWSRVLATEKVRAYHLTVTPTGNILVVGKYHGSPNLGSGPLPHIPEEEPWAGFFIARFSPRGEGTWAQGFASRGELGQYQLVVPYAVASDAEGSLLVTGIFSGKMNLGGGSLRSNSKGNTGYSWGEGGFVARFSGEGQHLWSRAFQSGDEDVFGTGIYGSSVAADEEGNVLVGGAAGAWTDLGDGRLRHGAPFIAKYSPTGSLLWKRVFKGAYGEVAEVKPQGSGRIVFAGNFGGAFSYAGRRYVGGDPEASYPEVPNTNGFIGALTEAGADGWLTSVGTGTGFSLWFKELAVGEDGTVTVGGQAEDVFDLGGGPMGFSMNFSPFFSTRRSFVARYSPEGRHQWSRTFDIDRDFKLALQPGGTVLLGTSLSWTFELDGNTWTPQGNSDLLYLRVLP